jgi:molybdenum cofactor cytidylyltransferase
VVVLADQPALDAAVIRQLIAVHQTSGRDLVAARYAGRHGAPALFHRRLFPRLTALTGEAGARDLLNGGDPPAAAVDLPALAADLDTPEDVRRWQQEHGCSAPLDSWD